MVPAAPLRRPRRLFALTVAAALLLAVGGMGGALLVKSPAEHAAEAAAPPRAVLTAPVEERVLTDTVILRGAVTPDQSVTISPGAQAAAGGGSVAPVVTSVRVRAGDLIRAGQVLVEVSGRPVFAFPGSLPVYRDLRPGSVGDDVAQLQRALRAARLSTGTDKTAFYGEGTKQAVAAFYDSIGYDVPLVGGDDNAELESAEAAVREAQRRYDELRANLRPDRPDRNDVSRQLLYAREDLHRTQTQLAAVRAKTGPMVPAAEVVFLRTLPGRVERTNATVGGPVKEDLLVVSAGQLLVSAKLQPHEKGLVKVGQRVEIAADFSDAAATGTISQVGEALERDEAAGGTPHHAVRVLPSKPLDSRFAGQSVRLTVIAASTDREVLAVPSSAVYSQPDGTTVVIRRSDDGHEQPIEVTVGLSGDGYVEVRPGVGGQLAAGDAVVVGR